MKKYIVIGSVAVLVLVAVSVFALQGKINQPVVAEEVAPLAAATSSSGCGAGDSGCGVSASAGCGGGASGGCGVSGSPEETKIRLDQITAYLTDFYTKKLGDTGITVSVEDFGCHQEATVTQAGQVVERLSISGSNITRIEG